MKIIFENREEEDYRIVQKIQSFLDFFHLHIYGAEYQDAALRVSAIKDGESCAGNTDKCVSSATCDATVCKCDPTKAIPAATGLCRKLFSFL